MSVSTVSPATTRTSVPGPVKAIRFLLGFLGITATAGGIAMAAGVGGDEFMPVAWLDGVPLIESWLVPGLVLGIGFGLGSLMTLLASIRRPAWPGTGQLWGRHWSWAAIMVIGLGHMVWIGLQLVYMPEVSVLQPIYGTIGLALFALPFLPSSRTHFAEH
jgi:hypothetical protein